MAGMRAFSSRPGTDASNPAIEKFVRAYVNAPDNEFVAVTALLVARRLCTMRRDKAEGLLTILNPAWRRQNPSEFLDDWLPHLGRVAPADLLEADDLGTEDLDRIIRENPQIMNPRQVFLPAVMMSSKLDTWSLVRRLLAITKGGVRLYSDSASVDWWIAPMEEQRRDRLKRESRRLQIVPSGELERVFSQVNMEDLVISSPESLHWRLAASVRANRLILVHRELLNSAFGWAVTQLVTSTKMDGEHVMFLDNVGVRMHRIQHWAQAASAFSPYEPASIVFIPAEVESTKDRSVASAT